MCKVVLLLSICHLLNSCVALAQQTATGQPAPAIRDPKAVSIINSAIVFLGGSPQLNAIQDSKIEGACSSVGRNGDDATSSSTFRFVNKGPEFRYDVTVGSITTTLLSGHGNPAAINGANVEKVSYYAAANSLPYFNPALLLFEEFNDPKVAFKYQGTEETPQGPAEVIETFRTGGSWPIPMSSQRWLFGETDSHPLSVTYRAPFEGAPDRFLSIEFAFSSYIRSGGFMVPENFTQTTDSNISICSIASSTSNTGPADSMFNPPNSGASQ